MGIEDFSELDLHPDVRKAIERLGFDRPMPIQAETLPKTVPGGNVTGQAQTGSGKTAAYLVAALHRLSTQAPRPERRPQDPRVLILAPTRELVKQIYDAALEMAADMDFQIHAVYGGVDYKEQRARFGDGVDVLIATPGRLIDYFKQKIFRLDCLDVMVIDECDRMFDMGFIDDVRWILRKAPPMDERQNLLFSATVDLRVQELAWEHMADPAYVSVDPDQTPPEEIEQSVYHVSLDEKLSLMVGLLRKQIYAEDPEARILVFANMRRSCMYVCDALRANGFRAQALSGAMTQEKRFKTLEALKQDDAPIVVATDVASRGLHIEGITHVINWDVPENPTDYVHRLGRTARAGATGKAIIVASEDTVENLLRIEEELEYKVPVMWPDDELFAEVQRPSRRKRRPGGKGAKGKGKGPPPKGKRGGGGPPSKRGRGGQKARSQSRRS